MKFCPNCGTPLTPGAKFCMECGQKLAVIPPAAPKQPAAPVKPAQPAQKPAVDDSKKPSAQPQTFTQPQDSYTPPKPIVQPQTFTQPQDGYTPPKPVVPPKTFTQPQDGYVPPKPQVPPQNFGQGQGGYVPPKPQVPPQNYGQGQGGYVPPKPQVPPQNYGQGQGGYVPPKPQVPPQNYGQGQGGYVPPKPQVPPQNFGQDQGGNGAYYGGAAQKPEKEPRQKTPPKKSGALKWILLGGGCLLAVALILVLVLSLSGGAAADDPNLGVYHAVSCQYMGMELGAEGEWIELKPRGRATIYLAGEEYSGYWTKEADGFYLEQGGDTFAGLLIDGTLTLKIADLYYTYEKEEDAPAPDTDNDTDNGWMFGNDPTDPADAGQDPAGDSVEADAADWDRCAVRFVGAERFADFYGDDNIRVYYDFTSKCDFTTFPSAEVGGSASQNGQPLMEFDSLHQEIVDEYGHNNRYVRPGITIRCVMEFALDPDGGMVQATLTNLVDADQAISITLDPNNLPGAPEPFVTEPVSDPQWISGWSDWDVYKDHYEIFVDTAEIIEGQQGEMLLRVYFDFTNLTAPDPINFSNATYTVAFQDGIMLDTSFPLEYVAEDENLYVNIGPGESIRVAMCFALESESPVEVTVNDWEEDTGVGAIFALN